MFADGFQCFHNKLWESFFFVYLTYIVNIVKIYKLAMWLPYNCITKTLRNAGNFSLPRCNTVAYGRHSLRYMGPFILLKLHNSVKVADFLNAFKNQIRALHLSSVVSKYNCKNCFLCKTKLSLILHCILRRILIVHIHIY